MPNEPIQNADGDILAEGASPCERLRIDKLGTICGIAPTPFRKAPGKIERDGRVEAGGNRGCAMAVIARSEFEDLSLSRTAKDNEALRRPLEIAKAALAKDVEPICDLTERHFALNVAVRCGNADRETAQRTR